MAAPMNVRGLGQLNPVHRPSLLFSSRPSKPQQGLPRPSITTAGSSKNQAGLNCGLWSSGKPFPLRKNALRPSPQKQQQEDPQPKHVVRAQDDDADELKKDWKFGRNEGPMTWPWKLCCAILYMLPWVDVTEKTVYFIERFPAFHWTEYFSEPFEHWFYIHEWAPLIIFFGTYLGIVRNKKIPHVARYHIMMGVMLDIIAMILIVVEENLPFGVLWTPWSDLFYALSFWFIFLLLVYCLFFCFLGWYCEIPLVSEGVYMQIEQAEMMGAGGR